MFPAHKRFRPDHAERIQIELGLDINDKFLVPQRRIHFAGDFLLFHEGFVHCVVIISDKGVIFAHNAFQSELRPVAHDAYRNVDVIDDKNAKIDFDFQTDGEIIQKRHGEVCKTQFIHLIMGHADAITVGIEPRPEIVHISGKRTDNIGEINQELIALLLAEEIIDDLKPFNIEINQRIDRIRVFVDLLGNFLIKRFLII